MRLIYTCAPDSGPGLNWQMEIGWQTALGAAASTAETTCDGVQHTLTEGPLQDNPGGNNTCTFTIGAITDPTYNQTMAAWSLTVEVAS